MPKLPFAEKAIDILQEYCVRNYRGNIRAMQTSLGMDPDVPYMNRWLKCFKRGGIVPKIDSIGPYLDKVGAVLYSPFEVPNPPVEPTSAPASVIEPSIGKELAEARKRIRELEALVRELQAYKVKWEAVLELERAKSGVAEPSKKESLIG